jgi:hypothetical protein
MDQAVTDFFLRDRLTTGTEPLGTLLRRVPFRIP